MCALLRTTVKINMDLCIAVWELHVFSFISKHVLLTSGNDCARLLPAPGKKADLVARVADHLSVAGGGA